MTSLLRQSVYIRLAGYEDVNDAQRLSLDPVMRVITGKKHRGKNAARPNTATLSHNNRWTGISSHPILRENILIRKKQIILFKIKKNSCT